MKKRILSLILALSMVLSVLPLGAFAAPPPELVMGANGLPDCLDGTSGNSWRCVKGDAHCVGDVQVVPRSFLSRSHAPKTSILVT